MSNEHYCFYEDDYRRKLEARFWNCSGKQIAVTASITRGVDSAAYIGTDAPNSWKEEDTLKYVDEHGCKLTEKDARYFFPNVELPYRQTDVTSLTGR